MATCRAIAPWLSTVGKTRRLKVGFEHATDRILAFFAACFKVKNTYIDEVVQQSVKKKVLPTIERRIRTELTEKAEEGTIQLFSDNLRNLPIGCSTEKGRVVLDLTHSLITGYGWLWPNSPTGKC